jgi:hypothetical protein
VTSNARFTVYHCSSLVSELLLKVAKSKKLWASMMSDSLEKILGILALERKKALLFSFLLYCVFALTFTVPVYHKVNYAHYGFTDFLIEFQFGGHNAFALIFNFNFVKFPLITLSLCSVPGAPARTALGVTVNFPAAAIWYLCSINLHDLI